jgi:adenylate cyclase class 2
LDETPIGDFLELDGPSYWIDETAARLGFSGEEYVTCSYYTLYQEYLRAHPEAPRNMTFLAPGGAASFT